MSTTEAEIVALFEANVEHECMHKLIKESNIVHGSLLEYCNNQAVVNIAHESGYTGRAKYIDHRYHVFQDFINRLEIFLTFCASNKTAMKILTKALLLRANEIRTKNLQKAVTPVERELLDASF